MAQELLAAKARRAEAEAEAEALRAEVAPLRRFVPTELASDELLAQLRVETSKRRQLEAEFRVVKGRLDEISARVRQRRLQPTQPPPKQPLLRWRAERPPARFDRVVAEIGKAAASKAASLIRHRWRSFSRPPDTRAPPQAQLWN